MRAIVLTWFLTQLVILVGDLDLLLPIVSGCFLICFCAVNLTCFVLELWREGGGGSGGGNGGRRRRRHVHFNWYSKWSALLGFVLSLAATFLNAISGECGCVVVWLCCCVVGVLLCGTVGAQVSATNYWNTALDIQYGVLKQHYLYQPLSTYNLCALVCSQERWLVS